MEGKLCEVLEEFGERCGDILRKILHWVKEIPYTPNDVVLRLLHRASKV